jgi:glycosyltransferase EpsD
MRKLVKDEHFDIIHCHTPMGSVVTRLAAKKVRKSGTRIIYTAHGFHFYKGAPKLNWMVFYPIEKACSRFTDKLITINKEDYELAKTKFKAKQVYYVPGVGVDLSRFENVSLERNAKRREIDVPEDAFLLLSVGELNENKNHQIIIRALAELDQPNTYYAIAGIGDKENDLLELANILGLSDRVRLLGYRKDVNELYHSADVFCFPSIREGLGLAAVEAMACGVPTVAADNRGTRSFVVPDINGFLCSSSSVDDFAEKINTMMQNSSLRKFMSEECKKTAADFSLHHVLIELQELYH